MGNVHLVPETPYGEVTGFTLSLFTKGEDMAGPYVTMGSQLNDKLVNVIRNWNHANTKLLIEDIHVNCNGRELTARPIVIDLEN